MKLGIFGDIHANLPALEAVYATLKKEKCHKLVSTGDIVGYGPHPCECIDFMMKHKIESVCGNHDEYTLLGSKGVQINKDARAVIEWTRSIIEYKHLKWLSELPNKIKIAGVEIIHASHIPTKKWAYLINEENISKSFEFQQSKVSFSGHTHLPMIATHIDGFDDKIRPLKSCKLYGGDKFMINVGSVGQPRDKNRKSCAVTYDTKTREIKVFRVAYDQSTVLESMKELGFSNFLINRLKKGN